ncbi:MAG: Ribose 5-phosphate isomerase B [Candidatus Gottesmanbacteria bacterium GW2011_GWA1_34_13]|uniref:Ribose 5-phosphate isomerase B n=1 Tax=Candidatus Gottesmanbacteria bacterium GW2011_GWA1_34_13 TaxID=1618434 RepID=A0A0G0AQI2_9BACT|nr:MAG: Ribose 5-phosphate isomerase B [Candidatus Gottesmanbacteria bacterium GW2011_GWA1_34_13]
MEVIAMIYIGADHGGFQIKQTVKNWLAEQGLQFTDLGAIDYNMQDDYPQYAFAVASQVGANTQDNIPWKDANKGILFCRTATGMVIVANKVKGIKAAALYNTEQAKKARLTNNCNIGVIAGDWTSEPQAREIIGIFLNTEFSREERHIRRVEQIKNFEDGV